MTRKIELFVVEGAATMINASTSAIISSSTKFETNDLQQGLVGFCEGVIKGIIV